MTLSVRSAWDLIKQTVTAFTEANAPRLSAALSFYTALSLAPLLLLVISIAGAVFGREAAQGQLVGQLKDLTGEQGAAAAEALLAASQPHQGGLIAGIVGAVTLLVGATGVFAALQDALNTVWKVPQWQTPSGLWAMVKDRLLSFSMVCGMAFLLLASLVVSAVMSGIGSVMLGFWPESAALIQVANVALTLVLTFAMFAMIFKLLPYARPAWSDTWVGAGITAVLFTIGKYLIGLYLGLAAVGSAYGVAGAFVALLVWIYYSSQILLFGAELTFIYAQRWGHGVEPVATEAEKADPLPASG